MTSCSSSVVFAGNATDIMLTHDHNDNAAMLLYCIESFAIFILPTLIPRTHENQNEVHNFDTYFGMAMTFNARIKPRIQYTCNGNTKKTLFSP